VIKISNYEGLHPMLDVAAESDLLHAMQTALVKGQIPMQVVGEGRYKEPRSGEQPVHRETCRLRPIR
jgi:hypothetical protein